MQRSLTPLWRMDEMNEPVVNIKRRTFLAAAVCAPALAAGAVLARNQSGAVAPPLAAKKSPVAQGYHETDHIREYYRSAAYL